jgi:tRNA pseudouridine38/39 synthase
MVKDAAITLHPVLQELGLFNKKTSPSALDVLQQLLELKSISEVEVRSAYRAAAIRQASNQTKSTAPGKELFWESQRTRHIALQIYYDGAPYSGLAENVGQDNDNSIEKALFKALEKARLVESREASGYSRCGRTDRGVSAAGQVVALKLKSSFQMDASTDPEGKNIVADDELPKNGIDTITVWVPPRKQKDGATRNKKEQNEYPYDKILNNLLPKDIRIMGWVPVSTDFSARFSAATRTYRYFFRKRQMNLKSIREGLEQIVGTHDFRNFCKMDVEKVYNFTRTIYQADVVEASNDVCFLQIHGQAFLWHQIRCIAGVLFLVGHGLETPDVVRALLNISKCPGKPSYPLADERPLVLHNCGYSHLEFGYSVHNLWCLICRQEQEYDDLVLAAARIRNNIDSLKDTANVMVDDLVEFADQKLAARQKQKGERVSSIVDRPFDTKLVKWCDALDWIRNELSLLPGPHTAKENAHTPLLERSKGTTYEEKVQALQNSQKRRQRYEDNVVKKRQTKEKDCEFYKHKAEQGGSAR